MANLVRWYLAAAMGTFLVGCDSHKTSDAHGALLYWRSWLVAAGTNERDEFVAAQFGDSGRVELLDYDGNTVSKATVHPPEANCDSGPVALAGFDADADGLTDVAVLDAGDCGNWILHGVSNGPPAPVSWSSLGLPGVFPEPALDSIPNSGLPGVSGLLMSSGPTNLTILAQAAGIWAPTGDSVLPDGMPLGPFDVSRAAVWIGYPGPNFNPRVFYQRLAAPTQIPLLGEIGSGLSWGAATAYPQLDVEYLAPFDGLDQLLVVPGCPNVAVAVGYFSFPAGQTPRWLQLVTFGSDGWTSHEVDNTVDISTMAIVQSQYGPLLAVLGRQNGQPLGLVAAFDACGGLSWRASIPLPSDFGKISDPNSTIRHTMTNSILPMGARGDIARFLTYDGRTVLMFSLVGTDLDWSIDLAIFTPTQTTPA
jgi:hypothetical protein